MPESKLILKLPEYVVLELQETPFLITALPSNAPSDRYIYSVLLLPEPRLVALPSVADQLTVA